MPVTISDELLNETGMDERQARVEIACRLFDAGKLTLPQASRWAGLSRVDFEHELLQRNIPLYRPTVQDLKDDLDAFDRLGVTDASGNQ